MVSAIEAPRYVEAPETYKKGDILIHEAEIIDRTKELAAQIARDYQGKELLIVGVMKGAVPTLTDLAKALHRIGYHNFRTDWLTVGSYGSGTESNRDPKLSQRMTRDPRGKHVFVVDEVSETGHTMKLVEDKLEDEGAESVASLVLVQKMGTRLVGNQATYIGFSIYSKKPLWLQGYGMDSEDGLGREDPDIRIGPYHYENESVPQPLSTA